MMVVINFEWNEWFVYIVVQWPLFICSSVRYFGVISFLRVWEGDKQNVWNYLQVWYQGLIA